MAAIEPAWFDPENFCEEVLNFCFRQLHVVSQETEEELNINPKELREAVSTVGKAVLTLQLMIRKRLKPLFIDCLNLIAVDSRDSCSLELVNFMTQGYLHSDVFNKTLSSFAIVAELLLFMDEFGFPVPADWYHVPWCVMYEYGLKRELLSNGGWERLLEKVNLWSTQIYDQVLIAVSENLPHPYIEVSERNNWPENTFVFVLERFGTLPPRNATMAMSILRTLYIEELGMPLPEDG